MTNETEEQAKPGQVIDVTPDLLSQWIQGGDTVLIDVREDFEHAAERIDDGPHHPLGRLDADAIRRANAGKRVVFYCRTGRRSKEAATKYMQGDGNTYHLSGGIEGWKAAGRSVIKPAGAPRLPVMRQVQIGAGSLVVIGVLLGALVSPWFLILAGFVGAGLVFAGLTGWCGMALLLAGMPWNRATSTNGSKASCAV